MGKVKKGEKLKQERRRNVRIGIKIKKEVKLIMIVPRNESEFGFKSNSRSDNLRI